MVGFAEPIYSPTGEKRLDFRRAFIVALYVMIVTNYDTCGVELY